MSQPLRNAFGHMHSLNVSGGEESIRYGIDLNYNASKNGVMKGSFRHIYGGGLTLDYRAGSWLQLLNNISYTVTESEDSLLMGSILNMLKHSLMLRYMMKRTLC